MDAGNCDLPGNHLHNTITLRGSCKWEKVVELVSEIMTYTKKMFDPLQPNVELVDIEDIAHALSMLCRANGHCLNLTP